MRIVLLLDQGVSYSEIREQLGAFPSTISRWEHGSAHWSLRKMAAVMKVNKNLIARIWKEADLKPRRLERYMAFNDPQFEEKVPPLSNCI